MRKVPLRKCCATQERLPKKELIRIVRCPDSNVIIDETGKANGRGAYLKKSKDAVALAMKTRCLDRSLEVSVPDEIFTLLMEMCNE